MNTNLHFLEKCQPAPGFVPVNMASAANNGARFDMSKFGRVAVVFIKGASTDADEDPVYSIQQHNAASGGSSKALQVTRIDHKHGTLASVAEFTTVIQAAADNWSLANGGHQAAVVVIDVKAEDLDIDNGFAWISGHVGDVGSVSQIGACLYFPHEPRYGAGRVNQHFLEKFQLVPAFAPVDMSTGSGPTSDVVNMKNYGRCAVVYFSAVGAAGRDTTLTLQQAQLVAGTPANLVFDRIDKKQAVDIFTVDEFTQVANAAHTHADEDSGEAGCLWVVDVKAEDLRIDEGYDSVVASVNDHSGAKLGTVLYLLHDPKYAKGTLPGAIAD